MRGDKYKLGILIPGFFKRLDTLLEEAKAISDDFLGFTKTQAKEDTGIKEWYIYKYLVKRRSAYV